MSKLTFPAAGKPYRGFVSQVRTWITKIATFVQDNPDARAEILSQIGAFTNSGDTALVSDNASVSVKNSVGSKTVTGATIDVAAGVVEDVNLPATAALITSAQELTGVAPSGAYATKVTFTVADGVITAIVLS